MGKGFGSQKKSCLPNQDSMQCRIYIKPEGEERERRAPKMAAFDSNVVVHAQEFSSS
jgi:hypothetical protein